MRPLTQEEEQCLIEALNQLVGSRPTRSEMRHGSDAERGVGCVAKIGLGLRPGLNRASARPAPSVGFRGRSRLDRVALRQGRMNRGGRALPRRTIAFLCRTAVRALARPNTFPPNVLPSRIHGDILPLSVTGSPNSNRIHSERAGFVLSRGRRIGGSKLPRCLVAKRALVGARDGLRACARRTKRLVTLPLEAPTPGVQSYG